MPKHAVAAFEEEIHPSALILRKIEATIGAFFAFLVGFVLVVLGGDIVYSAAGEPGFYYLLPVWLALVLLESAFLWKLKTCLESLSTRSRLGLRPVFAGAP